MSLKGFHHICIKVKDFDASVKLYTEGLGMSPKMTWGEGDKRGIMLDAGNDNWVEMFAGGCDEVPDGKWAHLALLTDECDKALSRAVNAGAVITMEPKDISFATATPYHARIAFCQGFDGEKIEFFQVK